MKKYRALKFVAGPVLFIIPDIGMSARSKVETVECEAVNDLLIEGYGIVEIVKHHSEDGTATMIVLGKE